MSRRSNRLGQVRRGLSDRLAAIRTTRTKRGVVVVATVLAVSLIAAGWMVPGSTGSLFEPLLKLFALSVPLVGILLGGVAVVRWWETETAWEPLQGTARGDGVTARTGVVGRETALEVASARRSHYRGHYRGGEYRKATDIRRTLRAGAVRRSKTEDGHDEETARSMVAAGEWTDDPVAGAFLSESAPYPLLDRIRAAIDPGRAYLRRVRRTVDAIDGERLTVTGSESSDDPTEPTSESDTSSRSEDGGDSLLDDERPKAATHTDGVDSESKAHPTAESRDGTPSTANSLDGWTVEAADSGWAIVVAVVIAGAGLALASPVLVVGATVPLAYAGAASLADRPEPTIAVGRELVTTADDVEAVHRSASTTVTGDPGAVVTVRLVVRNEGHVPLPDVRIVDGVPSTVPVVDGSPRACFTLDPGEETTVEYDVELQRGTHGFGCPTVRARDVTGVASVDGEVDVAGAATLACSPAVDRPPLSSGDHDHAGEIPTDEGGSGVEFHSVREYQPGDAVSSIDWRRYANSRDLATVEYRAERTTRVVCVVDANDEQSLRAVGSALTAVELCAQAGKRTAAQLLSDGYPTGAAALYQRDAPYVPPGTDKAVHDRVEELFERVQEDGRSYGGPIGTLRDDPATALPRVFPGETHVYLFSAMLDDEPLSFIKRLTLLGYRVCLVSPDVTAGRDRDESGAMSCEALGADVKAVERESRLARARATGATVLEWDLDRSLGVVLENAIDEVGR